MFVPFFLDGGRHNKSMTDLQDGQEELAASQGSGMGRWIACRSRDRSVDDEQTTWFLGQGYELPASLASATER